MHSMCVVFVKDAIIDDTTPVEKDIPLLRKVEDLMIPCCEFDLYDNDIPLDQWPAFTWDYYDLADGMYEVTKANRIRAKEMLDWPWPPYCYIAPDGSAHCRQMLLRADEKNLDSAWHWVNIPDYYAEFVNTINNNPDCVVVVLDIHW